MRGRKRSASKESQRLQVEARRERRRLDEVRRREAHAGEAALRVALARPPASANDTIERALEDCPAGRRKELRDFLTAVAERAPRLVAGDTVSALALLAEVGSVRPLAAWHRSGKSPETLFRSLAEHLLARYPMPSRLWTAFFAHQDAPVLARVAAHVASGRSLYDEVKAGVLPVPLTRKMCHETMAPGGESRFLHAMRRAQVTASDGDTRLFNAWIATRAGGRLHDRDGEQFWSQVLAWFGANPMLPQNEISPLVDYIEHRRAADPAFSIKGRSVLAMIRAMRQWHGDLAKERAAQGHVFPPSGLQPMDLDRSRRDSRGDKIIEIWHFREILDARTLADEGRAMGHCVYSYARSIDRGECAIWTLTLEDTTGHWRSLTIEVRPSLRRAVQARGRFNRMPQPRERLVLDTWATRNRLQVSIGG